LNFFNKGPDGTFTFTMPATEEMLDDKPLPLVDTPGDYGLWVRAVIEQDAVRNDSRPVMASGSEHKLKEICEIMAEGKQ
jgi:hypothetical protein